MDVLTDVLQRSRAHGAAFGHFTTYGEWGLHCGVRPGLTVHVMLQGRAVLSTSGGHLDLAAREVAVVRGSVRHRLARRHDSPAVPLVSFVEQSARADRPRQYSGGSGEEGAFAPSAVFVCGAYGFSGDLCSGLLTAMPDVLRVRAEAGGALAPVLDLLAAEVVRAAPGQQIVLDRLLDIILVTVLREHLPTEGAPAWFTALEDAGVAPALEAMHADPAHPWTVDTLARTVGSSRAAFARHFRDRVGAPPQQYLTEWRMALSRERLRDSSDSLAEIGRAVGYASEFSFSAAFRRRHGEPPGRWRDRVTGPAAAHAAGHGATTDQT